MPHQTEAIKRLTGYGCKEVPTISKEYWKFDCRCGVYYWVKKSDGTTWKGNTTGERRIVEKWRY